MGSWFSTVWSPAKGVPDLDGKVAIVTGANGGIGYETTLELARHGSKVYLASRNESKAVAAIAKLHQENPNIKKGNLTWLPLELEDLDKVHEAAQTFLAKETRLDILVNNAGMAAHSYRTTSNGYEVAMGVNHLGHFLFTAELLTLLKKTAGLKDADVRIVTVSSSGHRMLVPENLRFENVEDLKYHGVSAPDYSGMRDLFSRYAVSKLANILFCKELQLQLDEDKVPIISTTCNPGATNTEGGMSVWPAWMRPIMSRLFAHASKGALSVLYLASAPELKSNPSKYKAQYYNAVCKVELPSALARDAQVGRNLWRLSEEAVAPHMKSLDTNGQKVSEL